MSSVLIFLFLGVIWIPNKVASTWTSWGPWSECSQTCRNLNEEGNTTGVKVRARSCISTSNDGNQQCAGENEETAVCTTIIYCEEQLELFEGQTTDIVPTDASADYIIKMFVCDYYSSFCPAVINDGLAYCQEECDNQTSCALSAYNVHFDDPCPTKGKKLKIVYQYIRHGGWSEWTNDECPVSGCSSYRSKLNRTRKCDNPETAGGIYCIGESVLTIDCETAGCSVNGGWSHWTPFCPGTSKPCKYASSLVTRTRTCSNPKPINGGQPCVGNDTETDNCLNQNCPIWGEWSSWSEYSACSSTCGTGNIQRTRHCSALNGASCSGSSIDIQQCSNEAVCTVNGIWSSWGSWDACRPGCSSSNEYLVTRKRNCTNPTQQTGEIYCAGDSKESVGCTTRDCHRTSSSRPNKFKTFSMLTLPVAWCLIASTFACY